MADLKTNSTLQDFHLEGAQSCIELMENHNPSYFYGDPYRYPPIPPPNPDPYSSHPPLPPPQSNYPYTAPDSFTYPHDQPPFHANLNHSGVLDYQYAYPQPGLQQPASFPYGYSETGPPPAPPHSNSFSGIQQHASFQHGFSETGLPPAPPHSNSFLGLQQHASFQYGYSETGPPPAPSPSNSFPGYKQQDSLAYISAASSTNHEAAPEGYPPLGNMLGRLQLSDNYSSASQSSTAPSEFNSAPNCQSLSTEYDTEIQMYGYPNNSSSSSTGGPHYRPQSAYVPSTSFDSSQHNQCSQIVAVESVKGSLKVLLLHGTLDIWVYGAKNLPNMDRFHQKLTDVFGSMPQKIMSDPYVSISISNAVIGRTFVINNSENPIWSQHFYVPVAHYASEVQFIVKDNDVVGSQLIGVVRIPVGQLFLGAKIEGIFPVLNSGGKPCKPGAELKLSVQYHPIEKLSVYHHGVGAGPDYSGVPDTYFPLRKGGEVKLYQDAHVPDGFLQSLKLDDGMHYEHGQCWRDILEAITQARHLIYITGWSVYHKVRLVRDAGSATDITLGDLLKSKSQEGVRVLLLVWDDPSSRDVLGYQKDGLMQTHDEETHNFFKHSSVQVVLCPRSAGKKHSWAKQQEAGMIYSHHQKTVIVDADAGSNKRKIIAFIGGLDLCDGRYDTPKHPLFRTLETLHKDDYHNPNFKGSTVGCPRQPWHDLHCKIDGPAAYDVLTNFEERWSKASKKHGLKKLKRSSDDALLRLDRIPDIVAMLEAPCLNDNNPEAWHAQVFRSIDSNSAKGFPKEPKDAASKNLACGKNVLIDMSIHTAYVKAIRAAQHFIYIENQYFLGSSYNWSSYKDAGANNLIPMEIALKIASKIRANERFAAYIVVPMWPEGVPTGTATQRILCWQHNTMQMMYETIYKALKEVGLETVYFPQDYLNFFCLGNREAPDGTDISSRERPTASNTPQAQALTRKSRRFMIYVHSKGMIVDDEYVILGSANINQRSMDGSRDTEIAMGAYQPQHTWAKKLSSPHGQIYGYRMSLWAEHIGVVEDCFTQPESLECVKRVKFLGESNWRQFTADEVSEMSGHLLNYPVEVDREGKVNPITGCETFPDVGGNIIGTYFAIPGFTGGVGNMVGTVFANQENLTI